MGEVLFHPWALSRILREGPQDEYKEPVNRFSDDPAG